MNQLRLDPLSGRWVAVSTDREHTVTFTPRQAPRLDNSDSCPFCPGHEEGSTPSLELLGADGKWRVRVVPNRYPAFSGDDPFVVNHRGPVYTEAPASGIHEVLVFSPDHQLTWADFDDEQASLVMRAMRDRTETHRTTAGLRYSQAIVNAGREAGASIDHPHGQLLGIPFVPRELVDEQGGFARFAGGCLLCTANESEERVGYRVVERHPATITYAPYWSGTPYEMLIAPRIHQAHFHLATDEALAAIGVAIRNALAALRHTVGDVAYNVVFHAAPYRALAPFHWHVHILPKLVTRAGFELGTGVYINVVSPERAAGDLRASVKAVASAAHTAEDVAS
ncbi:MAG TPA: galactose-1-phosphate uridylyltransferase [Acidimicrobiales bacterium]|nr:galactose-1-phosphate uridylyltransferase [Acidimicrobiales bacterium]